MLYIALPYGDVASKKCQKKDLFGLITGLWSTNWNFFQHQKNEKFEGQKCYWKMFFKKKKKEKSFIFVSIILKAKHQTR